MATRADVEALAADTAAVIARANADLERMWQRIWSSIPDGPTKAAAVRDQLLLHIPRLVERYGEAAAAAAADWYDALRERAGAEGAYSARAAEVVRAKVVERDVRYHAGRLWTETPAGLLPALGLVVSKRVGQATRDTVSASVLRDPARPRWARVPRGAKTCAWCTALASRGPVYLTSGRAGDPLAEDARRFHADCDCQAVPVWRGDPLPEGYDPAGLYEMYEAAREAAGSGDLRDITEAMRRIFPDAVTDGITDHTP